MLSTAPNLTNAQVKNGQSGPEIAVTLDARGGKTLWATQSGPMLVIGGVLNPQIQDDGPSLHVRNTGIS